MQAISFLFCLAVLSCSLRPGAPADYLSRFGLAQAPSLERFTVCTSYGCQSAVDLWLVDAERQGLFGVFTPPAATALEERGMIASAVGLLEAMVGPRAGTDQDRPKNDWPPGQPRGQLDCIAEAANTTTFLLIIEGAGLLRFHHAAHPRARGIMPVSPHSTAVVRETATGREYAVDSWFGAGGDPAHVVPLGIWLDGWRPGAADKGS